MIKPSSTKADFNYLAGLENGLLWSSKLAISSFTIDSDHANEITIPASQELICYGLCAMNINPNIKVFANIQNIGDVEVIKLQITLVMSYYINGGRLASAGVTFHY